MLYPLPKTMPTEAESLNLVWEATAIFLLLKVDLN